MVTDDTSKLMADARSGDPMARQQLLVHYSHRLRKMIAAYLDPQLAPRLDPSDVLQEALTLAAGRLPKYLQDPPLPLYPWLRKIVREQLVIAHRKHVQASCRSVLRERNQQYLLPDESALHLANQLIGRESSPSQRASLGELRNRVRSMLQRLDSGDQELVLMRFVEQLRIGEIAETLEVSEASIKSRLARILQKLSHMVNDHE